MKGLVLYIDFLYSLMISYLKERTQKSQLTLKALINPQTASLPSPSTVNLIYFFCLLDIPSITVTHFSLQCIVLFSSIAEFIPHSKNSLRLFPHRENPSLSFPTIQILLASLILPLSHTCDYISPTDLFLLWMYMHSLPIPPILAFYALLDYFVLEALLWILRFLLLLL